MGQQTNSGLRQHQNGKTKTACASSGPKPLFNNGPQERRLMNLDRSPLKLTRLGAAVIALFLAVGTNSLQANPHYGNFDGFVIDMQEDGRSLKTVNMMTDPFSDNGVMILFPGSVILNNSPGQLVTSSDDSLLVRISFDQEMAAFGFDYATTNNQLHQVSENVNMRVFDSAGNEVTMLSGIVPPMQGFYGIGDKNSPLNFKTIEFQNVGTGTASWGTGNMYMMTAVPEPTALVLALLALAPAPLSRRRR
jgi:hypothetical protein